MAELLARISSRELAEWMAFDQLRAEQQEQARREAEAKMRARTARRG